MTQPNTVKVRITRDCEGPGDGYKAGQEVNCTAKDAELLRRRGFGVILDEKPADKK